MSVQRGDFRPPWQPADPAPAPALSEEERRRVAEFEAAPVLPESWQMTERVARAMHVSVCDCNQGATNVDRRMARAAIRALGGVS